MDKKIASYNYMVATLQAMARTRKDCRAMLQVLQEKSADDIWAMIQYLPRFTSGQQVLDYLSL